MINPEEEQLWIAEYNESKNNIPSLHNLVTKQIADEMKIELTADQDRILAESNSVEPEALDAYFKGLLYLDKVDRMSLIKAGEQFYRAIEIEPAWAPPYAGLAEADAFAAGRKLRVTKVPFSMSAKALINNDSRGFVKILSDPATGVVLGGSIVGRHAAELISVLALAVTAGLTVTDLVESLFVHPALAEVLGDAAE